MKRLARLPLKISFSIALKNIRVRFFRSTITTLSLVLAVAFLSFTMTSDDLAQSLYSVGNPEIIGQLTKLGYDISIAGESISSSPKQQWIVLLSLLVCVVGIVNAQVMSVTERFREIGTMKCLGALDGLVVKVFVIEAGIQGLIGSVSGSIMGMIGALLMGGLRFKMSALASLSWLSVMNSLASAILIGTILSLLGALYPAFLAARMQPVEAMRVEQ